MKRVKNLRATATFGISPKLSKAGKKTGRILAFHRDLLRNHQTSEKYTLLMLPGQGNRIEPKWDQMALAPSRHGRRNLAIKRDPRVVTGWSTVVDGTASFIGRAQLLPSAAICIRLPKVDIEPTYPTNESRRKSVSMLYCATSVSPGYSYKTALLVPLDGQRDIYSKNLQENNDWLK